MQATMQPGAIRRHGTRVRAAIVALLLLAALVVSVSPAVAATPDTNAWYVLVNRHSGKAMDVWEWSTADGGAVNQFARLDGYNQQWQFVDVGSGYYQVRSRHSGKVLEIPNSNDGVQVVQMAPSSNTRQHFRLADSAGGYVRLISRHSNKALDVWEWSTADGGMISQFSDLDGYNQQWQMVNLGSGGGPGPDPDPGPAPSGMVGWATQGGGTTGGGNASATTVSSASALTSALSASGAAVIRVSGTISCSGMLRVASNKTIIGNSGATITGCGFNIADATNVIGRNLTFRDWDDDAINVQYSQRVWIDHNTFTNGYDGAVDIKRASDYVTVSWNRLYNHDKNMLLGHSDSNASEDVGRLRVTYHHNWYDGGTRNPRVRFGNPVHVFNNYYNGNEYGVASTMGAGVLVEGNYFENVDQPTAVGYAASDPGTLVQRSNFFTGSGSPESAGSVNSIPYSYSLQSASSVKATVTAGAGAGRISP